MLVFASFVPHSPLLLSSVGSDKTAKAQATIDALAELSDELVASKPETIIILSSHAPVHESAFSINFHDSYSVDLSQFGDLNTKNQFFPDIAFIDRTQRAIRSEKIPITLDSFDKLDYGASVPMLLLAQRIEQLRIVPVSSSRLSAKDHFHFGQALKNQIFATSKRIAIIASGDNAHTLTSESPAGFNAMGAKYDATIIECIKETNAAGLLNLNKRMREKAKQCSYESLAILFGALDGVSVTPKILSYEYPFGVGYIVANFELS
ncbi:MAG: AMMECR1 protein [uncultured bacterium]|nr:MAG: AMMECR1 protein [uncultured bacterium]HBD05596.1 AmmeMemoRadiSam system protein B [Candidatus Uhrbacteria bacterium]